jgi:hypothetical protein
MIWNRFLSWVDAVHLITPDCSFGFPSTEPLPGQKHGKIQHKWRFVSVKSKQCVSLGDLTVAFKHAECRSRALFWVA